jgi:hypothetical protein
MEILMTDNLEALHLLTKCSSSDDFYFILIKDKDFILPLAINQHTNINKMITYIRRVCKSNGKVYLFLDKKSIKYLISNLMHEFINILSCDAEIFAKLKNSILNICCNNSCSVEKSKRFIINDNVFIPNIMLLKLNINKQSYYIGKVHSLDKRYVRYLKTYCGYQDNTKILIYSKND